MRILHLSGEREDVGGVLSVIRNLQTASAAWGWRHTVCVHREYKELRRPELSYWRSAYLLSDLPHHLPLLFRAGLAFFEVKRLLRAEAFDILHAHSRGAFLLALALSICLRRPVLYTNHGYSRRIMMYRWGAKVRTFHTVVLTPNMAKYYGLSGQPRVAVISECCADRFFNEPLAPLAAPSAPERPIRLVGIGNIMRWKNWRLLFEALGRLPEAERRRLIFSHWGPVPVDPDSQAYNRELREFVRARGLEKQCLFRGNTQSVSDCLRDADWFVLPSTNEPCSVALIEALALGVPALVSSSGGNVDIIQPGRTGILFEPDNAIDLAAKLLLIARSTVSVLPPAQIRESVRGRSASAVTAQYREVYERLAAAR